MLLDINVCRIYAQEDEFVAALKEQYGFSVWVGNTKMEYAYFITNWIPSFISFGIIGFYIYEGGHNNEYSFNMQNDSDVRVYVQIYECSGVSDAHEALMNEFGNCSAPHPFPLGSENGADIGDRCYLGYTNSASNSASNSAVVFVRNNVYVNVWASDSEYSVIAIAEALDAQILSLSLGLSVTITNPVDQAVIPFGNEIPIETLVTPGNGVISNLAFYANGDLLGTDSTAPYSYIWTNAPMGTNVLTAHVTDSHWATAISDPVTAIVTHPNPPPTVTLTAPTNGTVFGLTTNIVLEADASDTNGVVVNVEFFAGTLKVGEDDSTPFACVWSNTTPGTHFLTAVATDDGFATVESGRSRGGAVAEPGSDLEIAINETNQVPQTPPNP